MIGRETQLYISATVDPVKQIDLSIGTSYRLWGIDQGVSIETGVLDYIEYFIQLGLVECESF